MTACREAFEKWDLSQRPAASFTRDLESPDRYLWDGVQSRWEAWQAAWATQQARIERLEDEVLNRVLKDEEAAHG
jgi:hypothetical protein